MIPGIAVLFAATAADPPPVGEVVRSRGGVPRRPRNGRRPFRGPLSCPSQRWALSFIEQPQAVLRAIQPLVTAHPPSR
jgi:hypothetical protein